jgi:hypothetical protein
LRNSEGIACNYSFFIFSRSFFLFHFLLLVLSVPNWNCVVALRLFRIVCVTFAVLFKFHFCCFHVSCFSVSIGSELQLFFFLSSLAAAILVTPTLKPVAIHYNIYSEADRFVEHGQFVFPVILFLMYIGLIFHSKNEYLTQFRVHISLVVSLLILVLQAHASLTARGFGFCLFCYFVICYLLVIIFIIYYLINY